MRETSFLLSEVVAQTHQLHVERMKNISCICRTDHGRATMTLLVILGFGTLLLGFILSPISPVLSKGYPSKEAAPAIEFFRQHQADFERLRTLITAHPSLVYLHLKRREATPPDVFHHDKHALEEVLTLMTQLRLTSLNGPASSWGLRMSFWSQGMVMASQDLSFWFSEIPPDKDRIFATFGDHLPDKSGSGSAFCEIASHWYLRLDWGG